MLTIETQICKCTQGVLLNNMHNRVASSYQLQIQVLTSLLSLFTYKQNIIANNTLFISSFEVDKAHLTPISSAAATPLVALLISGGVDSSVALKLLLDQGHKVRAYYLKIWLEDELAHMNACPWDEDIRYAQSG